MFKAILTLILAAGIAAGAMSQDLPNLEFENETSWNSRYLWRGLILDSRPAVQSDNTLSLGSWYLNVWSTGRTARPSIMAGSDEVDVTIGWETTLGTVTLEPFATYYSFARGSGTRDTIEVGLTASLDVGGVTLLSNHYLDARTSSGAYYGEVGVELEREISENWTWGISVLVGWANGRFNAFNSEVEGDAVHAATGQLSLTYQASPAIYVRPSLTFSSLIDRKLRDAWNRPDNVVFTLALGFSK